MFLLLPCLLACFICVIRFLPLFFSHLWLWTSCRNSVDDEAAGWSKRERNPKSLVEASSSNWLIVRPLFLGFLDFILHLVNMMRAVVFESIKACLLEVIINTNTNLPGLAALKQIVCFLPFHFLQCPRLLSYLLCYYMNSSSKDCFTPSLWAHYNLIISRNCLLLGLHLSPTIIW